MKSHTTIAIVTKKRLFQLKKCLSSICRQSISPDTVLIIDNDSNRSAARVVKLKNFSTLKMQYVPCTGTVPKCRNMALQITKTKYLGFIDDDCELDSDWLRSGLQLIGRKKRAYVLGQTKLSNPHAVLAVAQFSRDAYWKNYNKGIFDTKNVIIDLQQIKKKRLSFDENCQSAVYDSADFDFDFQVKRAQLRGDGCAHMIAWHQETTNVQRFLERGYHRGKLAYYLDQKWHQKGKLSGGQDRFFLLWLLRTLKNFSHTSQQYQTYMPPQTKWKQLGATFFIRLFDRYYALGYASSFGKT